jgi:hypothetical protein
MEMSWADEESYEEMINALQNFKSQTEQQCLVMEQAGKDCVENTDGDPAAEKSNAKLVACVTQIRGALETVDALAAALQEELDRIRIAVYKVDQAD